MIEITTEIIPTLIAGSISGGTMGWLHHQLKPLKLHQLVNYTIGSASCLLAYSTSLLANFPISPALAVFRAWGIWVITGAIVAVAYLFDGVDKRRRRAWVHQAEEEEGDVNDYPK
jgi:hypothetical protein